MAEEDKKQLKPTSSIILSSPNTLRKWNGTGWEEIVPSAEEKVDDKGNGVHSKLLDYIGIPKGYGDQLYSGLVEDVQVFTATTSETANTFYSLVNWLCGRSEDKTEATSSNDGNENGETPETPVEQEQEQTSAENDEYSSAQEIEPSVESSQQPRSDVLLPSLPIPFPEETETYSRPTTSFAIQPPDEFRDRQIPLSSCVPTPPADFGNNHSNKQNEVSSDSDSKNEERLHSAPATHVGTISNNIGLPFSVERPPSNFSGDLQRTGSRVRFASSPALLQRCDQENRQHQPDENDNRRYQISAEDSCRYRIDDPHPLCSQHVANFTDVIHGSRVRFAANMLPNVGQPQKMPQTMGALTLPKLKATTEANNNPISSADFTNGNMRPSSSSNGNQKAPNASSDNLNQDLKTLENIIKKLYKNINKKGPLIIVANFKPKSDGDFQVDFESPKQKPMSTPVPSTNDPRPKRQPLNKPVPPRTETRPNQQSLYKPVPPPSDTRNVRTPTPVPINHISSSRLLFEIENPPSDYEKPYYEESRTTYEEFMHPHSMIQTSEEDEDIGYSDDNRKLKYDNNDYPISKEDDYQSEAFEESSSAKEDDNYYGESHYSHRRRGKKEQFNADMNMNRNHGVQPQVTKISPDMMAMMLRENPVNVERIVNVATVKTNNFQRQPSLIPTFPTRQSDITSKGQGGPTLRARSSSSHSFQQTQQFPSKQPYRTAVYNSSGPQRQNSYRELFRDRQTKGQTPQKTIYVDLTSSASKSSSFH